MTLPLAPPPPPPVARRGAFPPSCRPKVDSLIHLHETHSLSKQERERLVKSDVGKEFGLVLFRCSKYREKMLESKKQYHKTPEDPTKKQHHAMDILQYQSCLAAMSCPSRFQTFLKCWTFVDPKVAKELQEAGLLKHICKQERQAVERCAGRLASRGFEAAIGESFTDRMTR